MVFRRLWESKALVEMFRAKIRQRLLVDAGLLILLCLFIIVVSFTYVSSEHFFHSWDWANYHNWTVSKAIEFRRSPLQALYGIKESLSYDYNQIFTVPLLPFVLIFGDSRPVYIISVALIYLLPLALVIGAVAVKLIPFNPCAVFWSTALLTLLTPTAWVPNLRGFPDAGSASLIGLAILIYVKDTSLRHWKQIVLIGFLVAAAMLFRRHYAYDGVAYFICMALQAVMAFLTEVRQHAHQAVRKLFETALRICLVGVVSLATLVVIGRPFLHNVLTQDYATLYSSYRHPFGVVLGSYGGSYGWISWALAVLGYAAGIRARALARPIAIFILLFGGVSFVEWTVVVAQRVTHFKLHFTLFVVVGIAALGWLAWSRLEGRVRASLLGALSFYLILNFFVGLIPVDVVANSRMRPLLSTNYPPPVRKDYDQIVRLIAYLRTAAPAREPIYVVASSGLLNYDLVRNAEHVLYGRDNSVLNILDGPEVDSRDFYPLQRLLQAQYVLLVTPFEHHLRAQDVVKVVFVAFTENWEIAKDFARLPEQFVLENGAVVNVYCRKRPTSLEAALRAFDAMKNFIGLRPGGQPDWVILGGRFESSVGGYNGSYSIETRSRYGNTRATTPILFLSKLPERVKVTGIVRFYDDRCAGMTLRFAIVNLPTTVVDIAEIVRHPGDPTDEFALSFETQSGSQLLLSLTASSQNNSVDYCSVKIDHLELSAR